MKPNVGLITIGQSPRIDITPDLIDIWGDKINILEVGILDSLTEKEIVELKPKEHETLLVSRLRNGCYAELAEERLIPLLKERIRKIEDQVDLIFLLCTGEFPNLEGKIPIIQPDNILRNSVKGLLKSNQTLGVLVPEPEQIEENKKIWSKYINNNIIVESGSPYKDVEHINKAANRLKEKQADIIVLDCMGYSRKMKQEVKSITGTSVILPRTFIARIISELIEV